LQPQQKVNIFDISLFLSGYSEITADLTIKMAFCLEMSFLFYTFASYLYD